MNAKDMMTTVPTTISADASLMTAYTLMKEQGIRHLPVIDASGKSIGMISDRDVQRAMRVEKTGPISQSVSLDVDRSVEEFMSWPVYAVAESTPVRRLVEEFLAQKVSAFVVENQQGQLKGIVTTDDVLKLYLQEHHPQKTSALRNLGQLFLSGAFM